MIERVIDHYVADPLTRLVIAAFTGGPVDSVAETRLIETAYDFLERRLDGREWGAGDGFGLADCAAGPALFYANLKVPIGDRPRLAGWFARLRARPSFARVIEEARPWRDGTPFDWPGDY
jgi:glutathione S-transferase